MILHPDILTAAIALLMALILVVSFATRKPWLEYIKAEAKMMGMEERDEDKEGPDQ